MRTGAIFAFFAVTTSRAEVADFKVVKVTLVRVQFALPFPPFLSVVYEERVADPERSPWPLFFFFLLPLWQGRLGWLPRQQRLFPTLPAGEHSGGRPSFCPVGHWQ